MDFRDDVAPCAGRFVLDVYLRGKLIEHVDEDNLVVVGSKSALSRLIGGAFTGKNITTIGFGTSGTGLATGNAALTGAFTKPLDSAPTYPASNQVRFAFSLATTEANGLAIMEFGLITADSTLFSRKVRASALNKDTDLSFSGSWTLTF